MFYWLTKYTLGMTLKILFRPRAWGPGVRFGEPLDFSRHHAQEADGQLLRAITDEIMQAIAKLSGQEYVDIDARRAKAELAVGGQRDEGGDGGSRHDQAAGQDDGDLGDVAGLITPPDASTGAGSAF